jgi:hypothetical protein
MCVQQPRAPLFGAKYLWEKFILSPQKKEKRWLRALFDFDFF